MSSNIRTTFFQYVAMNILGMIGLSCYVLADTFFIAQGMGANGLTALNLAIPVYSFIHGTGLMIGIGGATRYTLSKTEDIFTQAAYYVCLAAVVFLMVGTLFARPLAALLGADGQVIDDTSVYLRVILTFSPAFLTNNLILSFVRNDGDPRLSMIAMLMGSLSNIVMDYLFIFPCKLGMLGAALATGIAPVVSLGILSTHFIKKKHTFRLVRTRFSFGKMKDISMLGISALITEISSAVVIIVFNFLILGLEGNIGVAAYGIIANISLVVMSIFTGISQGIQPVVSQSWGVGERDDAVQALRYGIVTAAALAVLTYGVSFGYSQEIVSAFNSEENARLAAIAVGGIRIYFTAFVFAGINVVCASYYSASDRPKRGFAISFCRGFLVIIPMAILLSKVFAINGVWLAMTVTEAVVLAGQIVGIFHSAPPKNMIK